MKDKPDDFPEKLTWDPELAFPLGMNRYGMNAESGFDTSLFDLDSLTGFPLWVNSVEVVMGGSVDFDLSTLDSYVDSAEWIMFRLGIYNAFPNQVSTQAYFLDASNNHIDSLFSEGSFVVPAGTPIADGENIDPSYARKDALFSRERIAPLEDATTILFRAVLLSQDIDTNLVFYYPGYYTDIEIGMMTNLTIEF